MFDFNLIIKIIFSAILLYLVVNSIFKYHVYNDLFISLMIFGWLIVLFIYRNLSYNLAFSILIGSITLISLGFFAYFKSKSIHFFWILNSNKQTYHRIRYFLKLNNTENLNYVYKKEFFWLLKFVNSDKLEVKKIMKGIEATETKRKSFTMCNYWQIIIFIVIMVKVWRF